MTLNCKGIPRPEPISRITEASARISTDSLSDDEFFVTDSSKVFMNQMRMATFIKAKLKQLDDQTNIVKYRVGANITEYHIISGH